MKPMDNANSHPFKVTLVQEEGIYANSHPYKVVIEGGGGGIEAKVVDELPEEGDPHYLYLVLKEETEEGNIYDEYIWALQQDESYAWEHLGATDAIPLILYTTTGQNEDGAMTQKSVTDELNKKADKRITLNVFNGVAVPVPNEDRYLLYKICLKSGTPQTYTQLKDLYSKGDVYLDDGQEIISMSGTGKRFRTSSKDGEIITEWVQSAPTSDPTNKTYYLQTTIYSQKTLYLGNPVPSDGTTYLKMYNEQALTNPIWGTELYEIYKRGTTTIFITPLASQSTTATQLQVIEMNPVTENGDVVYYITCADLLNHQFVKYGLPKDKANTNWATEMTIENISMGGQVPYYTLNELNQIWEEV